MLYVRSGERRKSESSEFAALPSRDIISVSMSYDEHGEAACFFLMMPCLDTRVSIWISKERIRHLYTLVACITPIKIVRMALQPHTKLLTI